MSSVIEINKPPVRQLSETLDISVVFSRILHLHLNKRFDAWEDF